MDGSRTTHMYRTYGSRVMQEQLPRSGCRGAVAEKSYFSFPRTCDGLVITSVGINSFMTSIDLNIVGLAPLASYFLYE